jgi:hypothetical protein
MNKDIDAVEMIRQVRDDIYEQTKEMSATDLVEFFRRRGSSVREGMTGVQGQRRGTVKRGL